MPTKDQVRDSTVSSKPGQDLAAEAQSVLLAGGVAGGIVAKIKKWCVFFLMSVY